MTSVTKTFFYDLLSTIAQRGHSSLGRAARNEDMAESNVKLDELCTELLSCRGEASGTALADIILNRYADLDAAARDVFFDNLADRFGPDRRQLGAAVKAWQAEPTDENSAELHFASEPRRQELFRRLNRAVGGIVALLRMREHVLEQLSTRPVLKVVDRDLAHLLASWFNRGFLVLKPIDWTTPANILERIMRYEAVHAIENWDELRNRLKPSDRRCFAFFHPQLIDDPLIFVEVALTTEIPGAISSLLEHKRAPLPAQDTTVAVFYSISNTQKGLVGVNFGNFLIKQVVAGLQHELPNLTTFVTLSPMPGFSAWLARERAHDTSAFIPAADRAALAQLDRPGWHADLMCCTALRAALMPAAAAYLLKARTAAGRPIDPVARFHLGNGARLERLNFLGDVSANGLAQSHGMMVNYRYALSDRKEPRGIRGGRVIAVSPSFQSRAGTMSLTTGGARRDIEIHAETN